MRRRALVNPYLLSAVLLLGACSQQDNEATATENSSPPVLVTTQHAAVQDLEIWLDSVGVVHSVIAPTLAAEVSGRITAVSAYAGKPVEAGQVLASTDTSTLKLRKRAARATIERLEVHIDNGERRVARFEKLSSRNLSSQTQLDDAREQLEAFRADLKAALAQLALVDDSLAKSVIIAPVSGIIQNRYISTGDFVQRGQALFDINLPRHLQAWLAYPETQAAAIHIGQPVRIRSPLTKGVVYTGSITDLQPALGQGSRALMTITDIKNPGKLRPEATITGRILVATHTRAVMVPETSVVRRPAGEVVYLINGNTAHARSVETGKRQDGKVEILSGLKGNETIAAQGASFLTDGARVTVREPTD